MHLAIGALTPGPLPGAVKPEPPSPSPAEANSDGSKLDDKVIESIKSGIADLTEMVPCHHFASQALNILRYLAKKWNIHVDMNSKEQTMADDPWTDKSVRPLSTSLNFFAPNVTEGDFSCNWGPGATPQAPAAAGSSVEPSADVATAANAMDNPLFWPFPLQGRPMLPTGDLLEEAGFAILDF